MVVVYVSGAIPQIQHRVTQRNFRGQRGSREHKIVQFCLGFTCETGLLLFITSKKKKVMWPTLAAIKPPFLVRFWNDQDGESTWRVLMKVNPTWLTDVDIIRSWSSPWSPQCLVRWEVIFRFLTAHRVSSGGCRKRSLRRWSYAHGCYPERTWISSSTNSIDGDFTWVNW